MYGTVIISDARYLKSVSLKFLETFILKAFLICFPMNFRDFSEIEYGIVIIFDARYLKCVSLNFLETFRN